MKCKFCEESFGFNRDREEHTKLIHKKIEIFQCKICHEKCKGSDNFDKHLTFVNGTNHWYINLGMRELRRSLS